MSGTSFLSDASRKCSKTRMQVESKTIIQYKQDNKSYQKNFKNWCNHRRDFFFGLWEPLVEDLAASELVLAAFPALPDAWLDLELLGPLAE